MVRPSPRASTGRADPSAGSRITMSTRWAIASGNWRTLIGTTGLPSTVNTVPSTLPSSIMKLVEAAALMMRSLTSAPFSTSNTCGSASVRSLARKAS